MFRSLYKLGHQSPWGQSIDSSFFLTLIICNMATHDYPRHIIIAAPSSANTFSVQWVLAPWGVGGGGECCRWWKPSPPKNTQLEHCHTQKIQDAEHAPLYPPFFLIWDASFSSLRRLLCARLRRWNECRIDEQDFLFFFWSSKSYFLDAGTRG